MRPGPRCMRPSTGRLPRRQFLLGQHQPTCRKTATSGTSSRRSSARRPPIRPSARSASGGTAVDVWIAFAEPLTPPSAGRPRRDQRSRAAAGQRGARACTPLRQRVLYRRAAADVAMRCWSRPRRTTHRTWPRFALHGSHRPRRQRAAGAHHAQRLSLERTGENLASGVMSADAVVMGWLGSPEHCANIMNPAYSQIGVGVRGEPARCGGRLLGAGVRPPGPAGSAERGACKLARALAVIFGRRLS